MWTLYLFSVYYFTLHTFPVVEHIRFSFVLFFVLYNRLNLGLVKSLVAGRQIAAAAVVEGDSCEFASLKYFALCGLGGKLPTISLFCK